MAKKATKNTDKPKKPPRKSGRPPTYDPEFHPQQAFKLAILGCVDSEIASNFNISAETLCRWKDKHPEFGQAIREGGEPADAAVADALRQRAMGYEWEEEVATKVKVSKDEEKVIITKVRRIVPPDTQAASLFLRNRQSKKWRDKVEVEHSGTVETRAARIKKAREKAKGAADGDE